MMKCLTSFVFVFSIQALAQNPLIHYCNLTSGTFHAIEIDGDQVGYCRYGSAMIDALSILETTTGQRQSQASSQALGSGASCEDVGGQVLNGTDLEGHSFSICRFDDASSLQTSTLAGGSGAAENAGLVQALQTRF